MRFLISPRRRFIRVQSVTAWHFPPKKTCKRNRNKPAAERRVTTTMIERNRPEGYMTIAEWAEREGVKHGTAYSATQFGRIPYTRVRQFVYIHPDVRWEKAA